MKKAIGKRIVLSLVALSLLAAIAGCAGGGVQNDPGPSEPAAPSGDSILRVGISGTPDTDPAVATTGSSVTAVNNLYDPLVFPGKDGLELRVAESWTVSDDGLTYTFKIKEGIKFHDGTEMKASDVAFSMNRVLAIGEGYAWLYTDFVDNAEAISDYEVVFNMKRPYGPFVSALVRFLIVNEDLVMANIASGPYGDFGDYGKAFLATNSAGSGAYMFKELVQQDFFEAVKFDDWFMGWADKPNAPSGFKQLAIPEPTTVRTMMNNGELDMTDQWQSTENLTAMAQMPGVSVVGYSTYLVQNMYFHNRKAPMDDVNYRRAIASLIDYNTLVSDIYIGSGLAQGPVASGAAGAVPTNVMTYSVDKAREYIAASQYADNYQDYTIDLLVIADVADAEKVALLFQAAAAELGITVEISRAPWVSVIDRTGSMDSTPHMLSVTSGPAYNEAGVYLEARYHSKTTGTWEQGEWLLSAELDGMMEDALATIDDAERFAKYAAIQHFMVDELYPSAWLCDLVERVAYRSDIIKWPLVDVPEGQMGSTLFGFYNIFAEMELTR